MRFIRLSFLISQCRPGDSCLDSFRCVECVVVVVPLPEVRLVCVVVVLVGSDTIDDSMQTNGPTYHFLPGRMTRGGVARSLS